MNRQIGRVLALIFMIILLSVGGALAESGGPAYGGFAVQAENTIYLAVSGEEGQSLYSIPAEGGEFSLVDRADEISQLVNTPEGVFYLRNQGTTGIFRVDGEMLADFDQGQRVKALCFYDSGLYCLVDGHLTRVEMNGEYRTVSDQVMDEFALKGGEALYVSADDRMHYEQDGQQAQAGRLYRLDLNSGACELVLDAGVNGIKLLGDYLYFHNLEDAYVVADGGSSFLAGRLYRLNLSDGALQAVNCDYDLDYFLTDSGLVLRTEWDISRCSLSGGDVKQLLATDHSASVAISGSNALVYMRAEGLLIKVPLDGSQVQILGKIAEDEEKLVEAASSQDVEDQGDQDYIFPDSNKKRLERAEVEALDPELLGYARNEIYARHGYEFKNGKYADYFNAKSWYQPGGFSKSDLNSIEWYNMDLIAAVEEEYKQQSDGEQPQTTADYIFPDSDKYKLTREEIEQVDPALWPYARNEIYARHGYVFNKEKYARYFMSKSWYKPGGFSESSLNSVEWYNMELLSQMESEYSG